MIAGLPWYVPAAILFVNATFFTFWMTNLPGALRRAGIAKPGPIVGSIGAILLAWMALQAFLSASGFYLDNADTSPRFLLGIGPPLTALVVLLAWPTSRRVFDQIGLAPLTYVHSVRFLVELVVYALYAYGQTPRLMTFVGRNPDILIGATAPLIGFFCFTRKVISFKVGLAWHVLGLALLANVATLFVLSVPSPFRVFATEQPNVGFFAFPFIWAPTHGVPTVILAHCIAVRTLARSLRRQPAAEASTLGGEYPYSTPATRRNR